MEPTAHGLIALAVIALLFGMRRRRTGAGISESQAIAHKQSQRGSWIKQP